MDEADAGPALGLKKHTEYRTSSRQIDVGDAIVLFTDGVTEAMNPAHAEYGEDRLQKTIRAALERGESDLPRSILDDLHVFMDTEPAHDDICVVSVEAVEISK
jgi:sigma-B regulation protein RsbU (phosphoserine phosphatase)